MSKLSLYKQYRRIIILRVENGIGLVGHQIAEDGVLFIWII